MNDDRYMDPIPEDDYHRWAESQHADTINTQGADPHAGCSIYAPAMCSTCDALYADLFLDGEYDFAEGIALEDGFRAIKAQHPEIPERADGPASGYCHGWSAASLRSQLRIVELPFTEFRPPAIRPIGAVRIGRTGVA